MIHKYIAEGLFVYVVMIIQKLVHISLLFVAIKGNQDLE